MELRIDPKGNYTEYNKKFYVLTKDDKKWAELAKKLEIKLADLKKLNKGVGEDEFHTGKQIRITK